MPLPFLSKSCYTSIEGLGNPWHLRQNGHKKMILEGFKLTLPDDVSANALSEFMLRGNFSGYIFYN
nr:MAG TPA: hypothetical protein [Caudoviricetes sp.]